MKIRSIARMAAAVVLAAAATASAQQQILLDKPVRGGELTLFPDLNDANAYYYVVDKPKLATDANGRPQFSFLRYAENVRGTGGADAPREAEGGGIVHAVVVLAVTRDQIQAAQRDLQRVKPGAIVRGPAIFKSGKFGLVTSFKDPSGKLATQVLGIGIAPLLDEEKAAVSMQLTKQGAKLLWESFNTAAPDISFTFEMELPGYMSPKRGLIEADFDQIYEHQTFNAGVATQLLAGEIRVALEDLSRRGVIKVTQVGADQEMESLLNTAYTKIAEMMFSPVNGTGTPSLSSLAGGAGGAGTQGSLLDRASTMLTNSRAEARAENEKRRAEARASDRDGSTTTTRTGGGAGGDGTTTTTTDPGDALTGPKSRSDVRVPTDSEARRPGSVTHEEASERERRNAAPREVSEPTVAVVAAFEMRRVRQRGIFRIDLNKYTTDTLTLRFDENIGDLTSLRSDTRHFREINLDDPLYRQREIAVMVDGLNAQDFGQYINFVTVQMRKKHGGGDETLDEVRIDRKNFNLEGNRFGLLYGWKNDTDRRRWLEYEYRPVWSFFGGVPVEGAWKQTTDAALNMAPPFQRRTIDLQANPEAIQTAGVRAVTVKVFYTLAGTEKSRVVTLTPAKGQLSGTLELLQPADATDYAYEITWQLTGNRTRTSGRQTSSSSVLFVDEVPAS